MQQNQFQDLFGQEQVHFALYCYHELGAVGIDSELCLAADIAVGRDSLHIMKPFQLLRADLQTYALGFATVVNMQDLSEIVLVGYDFVTLVHILVLEVLLVVESFD